MSEMKKDMTVVYPVSDEGKKRYAEALRPGGHLHEALAEAMGLRGADPSGFERCRGDGVNSCGHSTHTGRCRGNAGACACQGKA